MDDDQDQDLIELKSVEVFDPIQKRRYNVIVREDLEILQPEGNSSDLEGESYFTQDEANQEQAITWSQNETLALINIVSLHKDKFKSFKVKKDRWKLVSRELAKIGIEKLPQKCETKWRNLLRTYKVYKRGRKPAGKFEFFNELDEIIANDPQFKNIYEGLSACSSNSYSDKTDMKPEIKDLKEKPIYPLKLSTSDYQEFTEPQVKKKKCPVCKSEKQKRHEDRMELLKKKLEVEERKVKVFEDYVEFLKSTHRETLQL